MRIREACAADAPAIAIVHVKSWYTAYAGVVSDDYLARLSYRRREDHWRKVLSQTNHPEFVYVAEDASGRVVGFASGGPERDRHPVYKGELYTIYLLEHCQRQGSGRQLVLSVVQRLLRQNWDSMLVWVLAANPACAFYEALGGEWVAQRVIDVGGTPLPEVAYGWRDIRGVSEPAQLDQ